MAELEADTKEWHDARARGVGGSDASAIMGVSPWLTSYGLWMLKTKRVEPPPSNPAMRRGTAMEPVARAGYVRETGILMEPARLVHPELAWMLANMDGVTGNGRGGLEVKCPGAKAHADALAGKVPEYYTPQLAHYLEVGRAACDMEWLDYWSFDGTTGVRIRVTQDKAYTEALVAEEAAFWDLVVFDQPPPLTERDTLVREDEAWIEAARCYREYEAAATEWKRKQEAAREVLIRLKGAWPRVAGGGLSVCEYEVRGNVDYKKVPELRGVDLEPYRGAIRTQVRVSIVEGVD